MARDYFAEAKWREEKYKPKTEEYLTVATASTAYTSLMIISLTSTKPALYAGLKETYIIILV
ncbi:hypothetical protein ACS0TY_018819 [Phlomoides rotata]